MHSAFTWEESPSASAPAEELDRRIILRMATQQTPYFRAYSRTRSLDTGQRGAEHVYCRCGHCCRSQLRARVQEVGLSLFIVGALATSIPLIAGILMAKYIFKFHPALVLGCTAGARTTTAALGAIQEAVESETPALGYTVTYAVGNTLLIIWGVVIVLLM